MERSGIPAQPPGEEGRGAPSQQGPLQISRHAWQLLVVGAAIVTAGLTLVEGNWQAALGLGIFFALLLLPLYVPATAVLVFFAVSWFPFESILGTERSLFAAAGGINVSGLRLIGAVLGLGLAVLLLRRRIAALRVPTTILIGVAVYAALIAWALITVLWTPDQLDGLRAVAKLALPLLVGAIIAADPQGWGPQRMVWRVFAVLAASLAVATAFGFSDTVPTYEPGEIGEIWAWAGRSSHAFFAGVVAVLAVALADNGFVRRSLWAAVLAIAQLPYTVSRIGVAATGIAVSWMLAISGVRRWLAPLGIISAAALFIFFPPIVDRNVYEQLPPAEDAGRPAKDAGQGAPTDGDEGRGASAAESTVDAVGSVASDPFELPSFIRFEGREGLWEQALGEMSGGDWAHGNGLGAWFTQAGGSENSGGSQLHGEFIRLLYETGAVGLALVLTAYALLSLGFARVALASPVRTLARATATAALGLIVVYVVTLTTDNTLDYYVVGSYVWAGLGLAVLTTRPPPERTA